MNKLPVVAIVGRTNVGKSTLFNRLSTNAKSITLDQEGVTRDFIKDVISWQDRTFSLVDTGGITIRRSQDPITEKVRQRVLTVIEQADIILFVCDGAAGLVAEDRELASLVRKTGKPVFLVINKSDRKDAQDASWEFNQLGFQPTFFISAQHGMGIAELLEVLAQKLPETHVQASDERICKIVLLGKPNVGKSSLMNILLNQERSIVHDQPGTTREAITEKISFYKEDIQVTDTAGVRRKRVIDEELETLMVKSSFQAVQNANIVMLLIDGSEGVLADQELKLAFYTLEHHKALIILFNKEDLVEGRTQETMEHSLEEYRYVMDKVPQLHISCITGKNVGKVLPLVQQVWKRYSQSFSEVQLTQLLKEALYEKPLYHKTQLLMLYHAKQIRTAPITIAIYVNEPDWFGQSQLAFLDNIVRKKFDLTGVPVAFAVRKRG
ncbi:MAG TPA: ribosome biogenesis GTPase Der [Candidatus Limnocylindria bacterium]|nr:ribosome biogenesis GTPase Der [Candidatus Limnocylindria bacterium]